MNLPNLLVASNNQGKLIEISQALSSLPLKFEIVSLKKFSHVPEVAETGKTFFENASIKARAYAAFSGLTTLADDSGLVVTALGGTPGVYSARYAGEGASDKENRQKLLEEMKTIPVGKRQADFVCVLALYDPVTQEEIFFEGRMEGEILFEERGSRGFGYDSVFFVPSLGKTTAELSLEEKNKISHRGLAIQKLKNHFQL